MDAKPARLNRMERHTFIENLIKNVEEDNRALLEKQRDRLHRVGVEFPRIEVKYKNLSVDATCEVVHGKPLPTLWNTTKSTFLGFAKICGLKPHEAKISILRDVSGIIKPGRMTLLLGPPGSGKTTLLSALAGKLKQPLKVSGEITYNGYTMEEFVPQKTSAYISQYDLHIPQMTVRETLDFSARCQGVGSRAEIMAEVSAREKLVGFVPDAQIDTYMKEIAAKGLKRSLQTDYIFKILGLDVCGDIMVGDVMRRGISGGQKKRLTTGEMIVGPSRALFMDSISSGLDSSTTLQVVACLQQLVHITEVTALISLLQPAPEVFNLFDDIILMAQGTIIYHGPRNCILEFFENCGFRCPERKGIADFLQEVISRKDQAQYWCQMDVPYTYVNVIQFSERFKHSHFGKSLDEELSKTCDGTQLQKNALSFNIYSLTRWELFKACMTREFLLIKRDSLVYASRLTQIVFIGLITMTVFLRTKMKVDLVHANVYMGSLYYALVRLMTSGIAEMQLTVHRLPIFYKQRDFFFFPAWAYAISTSILKIPFSLVESFTWTALTYYVIGYSPKAGRFFGQFLLLFAMHQASTSLFRFIASVTQRPVVTSSSGIMSLFIITIFGGILLPKTSLPTWLQWIFWLNPLTYAQIGISTNEFLAPRWQKHSSGNMTIGHLVLRSRGLDYEGYFYWVSFGALIGFTILFNIGFTVALTYLNAPGTSRTIISIEQLSLQQGREYNSCETLGSSSPTVTIEETKEGRMILPFAPVTMTFENVQYCVETPQEMRKQGFAERKLQLLWDITGVFRPGVLMALMGVSGAGKTTLMDVLSGRKTSGFIDGDIRIGGYPKVQETFARVSGYCEQSDIHSPHITVEESVIYSAWLRLPHQIDPSTKAIFVKEVLKTIELDTVKDILVGIPGETGLSTEQRKRLTIAVELVANPSIIFMDEPTSGLDARTAAIVMRAVKNVVDTGRTVVCTIHQPSIDIVESFDELFLMKRGQMIYTGPLGHRSSKLIEYFEGISGVPKFKESQNPAAWMLEVTSTSSENRLGLNFAQIFKESRLYQDNKELVKQLSVPLVDSADLHFPTRFAQNGWVQFKACLWKQHLSYWRSPTYILIGFIVMIITSVSLGATFWQHGKKINNEQDLFTIAGSMFVATLFLALTSCSTVIPIVARERTIVYREKFAGMYSSWAYSFAQVTIEIPYILLQTIIFVTIIYPAIGHYWSAYKAFWYLYTIFCYLLSLKYLGMMIMSLSPNTQVASLMASPCYSLLSLFSGFQIPRPQIPKWWVWLYWLTPTSWALNGLLTSQYGDISKEIVAFGKPIAVDSFLRQHFGFEHNFLGVVAVVLVFFPVLFASLFAYFVAKLNFQRR